jgi:hypothetical protein
VIFYTISDRIITWPIEDSSSLVRLLKGAHVFFQSFLAFIFSIVILFQTSSFAQSGNPKFSIGAAAMAGQGKMGNGASDAPDRDMIYIPIAFFAGFNIKKFRVGLNYEYFMGNQSTDPAEVAGTNTSGTGNALGLRLEFYNGKQSFGAVYRASSTFALEKQTLLGTTATYKGSGFSLQYMVQLKKKFGLILDYTTDNYKDSLDTSPVKTSRVGLGVVFSNFTGR